MLWRKKANPQSNPSSSQRAARKATPAPEGGGLAGVTEALADDALDTLAAVVRAFGRHAFDLEGTDKGTVARVCEAWAANVLNAGPVESADVPAGERSWGGLRRFMAEHRKAEQTFVEGRIGALKDVIWGFVHGLREIAGGGTTLDTEMETALSSLEQVAMGGDLRALSAQVPSAVAAMRKALSDHKARTRAQIDEMAAKLENLTVDLLETRRQAELDPLTQVSNRRAFDEQFERYAALSLTTGRPLALAMFDLDHFKSINDTYGHQGGDTVLKAAAECLVRSFPRRDDLVARYGGEEFAVLVFDADAEAMGKLVGRLLLRLRRLQVEHEGRSIRVTASVGYACLRRDESPEALIGRADAALYRAKETGRDRAVVAQP